MERETISQKNEAETLEFEARLDFRNLRMWRMNLRIREIESAKPIADLNTSYSITGAKLQTNFEVLDSKRRVLLQEDHQWRDFERRVLIQEDAARKEKSFPTGRQVAWMIFEHLKVGDTDESALDVNEILKVKLKNDNGQSFDARWDETMIAMKEQHPEEIGDNENFRQLQQSEQLKPMLAL